jgi:hypothetical protein
MTDTVDIIFTNRPVSIRPISWVNAITRVHTKSPFDHVSLEYRDTVFESAAPKGVQKLHWNDWVEDRKGTYLICYQVPRSEVSFHVFESLEGRKYDYPANMYHLFGWDRLLKKRKTKRIYCSELIAMMLGMKDAHEVTPDDLERRLREYPSYIMEL